jgi:hypothetical protein
VLWSLTNVAEERAKSQSMLHPNVPAFVFQTVVAPESGNWEAVLDVAGPPGAVGA